MSLWQIIYLVYLAFGLGYAVYNMFPWKEYMKELDEEFTVHVRKFVPEGHLPALKALGVSIAFVIDTASWPYQMHKENRARKEIEAEEE